MARGFSAADARQLIREHSELKNRLQTAAGLAEAYRAEVLASSENLLEKEVVNILCDMPVEEINRNKRGFRVKALRESGYVTMADLAMASVKAIADVNGISEDSAYAIKLILKDLTARTRKGLKIRLSLDDRNPEATVLVKALSRVKNSMPYTVACQRLLHSAGSSVDRETAALAPAQNGLKWLFCSASVKKAAESAYVRLRLMLDGQYGRDARDALAALDGIKERSGEDAWNEFAADPIGFFTILEQINPGILGSDDDVYGLPEELAAGLQDESVCLDGLNCQLRRYQEWGVKYILHQGRVLLGDEMGLGKTVQAIAAMVALRNTGSTHFAVVCPASVITNWSREIKKMSDLSVSEVHGPGRGAALRSWITGGGVAVTTYETCEHFLLPADFRFSLLVVDEAHYIKNPETKRSRNVRLLCGRAERLLFMTGTALENDVDEMMSLIRILQPETAEKAGRLTRISAAPQFREAVAPVYYRRKRDEVLTELPELIVSEEWCTLSEHERRIYNLSVLSENLAEMRRVSWNVDDLSQSVKAKRLLEIVEEARSEGRKVLVFSFFLDTIRKVLSLLGEGCYGPINGSVPPQRRQEIIDEFDKAPAGSVLAAQIQAGGTGLNIQSASVVVLCEPQFKPSVENQAISRAYRMGQARNVLVYRLLCENTVEERIMEILDEKQRSFDAFANDSAAAEETVELDAGAFVDIIREEIDRIRAEIGNAAEAIL